VKRRAAALFLCALLVLQLPATPAKAAENVYFVAAQEYVLPLSDSTMPFWYGGYLYIPATMFTGNVRRAFNISYNYNEANRVVILYGSGSNRDRSLMFYLDQNSSQDRNGNIYHPGSVLRHGTPYVPAFLVAQYFDLVYSVTEVQHGYLVWLRQPNFGMTDKLFANAATYSMEQQYGEYLKSKGETAGGTTAGPSGVEVDGKSIYLCLEAGENTAQLLDVLDQYGAQAAFFCTPEFLETQGGLLRRMAATGQSIAILADAGDPDHTVEEQLERGNRALAQATCGKTRLAYLKNGDERAAQAVRDLGLRPLKADLDRSSYDLHSGANAASLLQRVSDRRGDVTVWLGDSADAVGLRAFLAAAERAEGRCLAWTETA